MFRVRPHVQVWRVPGRVSGIVGIGKWGRGCRGGGMVASSFVCTGGSGVCK